MHKLALALALLILLGAASRAPAQSIVPRQASMAGHPTSNSCPKTVMQTGSSAYTVIRCPDTGTARTWFIPYAFPENASTTLQFRVAFAQRGATQGRCTYRVGISCNPDGTNQTNATNPQTFLSKEIVTASPIGQDEVVNMDSSTGITPTNDATNAGCDSTACDNADCLISIENDPDNTQINECDFYSIAIY